jgi:hypothetical protein
MGEPISIGVFLVILILISLFIGSLCHLAEVMEMRHKKCGGRFHVYDTSGLPTRMEHQVCDKCWVTRSVRVYH